MRNAKRWVLPGCLILAGLVLAALGILHASMAIPQAQAEKIASDYAKANVSGSKGEVRYALLTSDLVSLVAGSQKWIVEMNDTYTWITIDAYTGKLENEDTGFRELLSPASIPWASGYTSLLMLIPYGAMVAFSFVYWKNTLFKVLFWISVSLLFLSYFTFRILAFLVIIAMGMSWSL